MIYKDVVQVNSEPVQIRYVFVRLNVSAFAYVLSLQQNHLFV